MSSIRVTIYIFVSIVVLLYVIRIILIVNLSVESYQLQSLRDRIAVLERVNMHLKEQYLQEQSYTTIQSKARARGFTPAQRVFLKGGE
jgi:predicted Holliday junction resolvase-like endonuclease